MAEALPRNVQLKLEQTLAQWPHWLCDPALTTAPEVVAVLTPGVSNFSVLVESGQHFVVRIDGVNPVINGLNRQAEWHALETAHNGGLAPHPRYFNPDLGSLVCDYLTPDDTQDLCIPDVARLLREIHQLPARHHRLDLAERILRYEKQLEHRGRLLTGALLHCHAKVSELVHDNNRQLDRAVLCHNDLLRANRIYSGMRLWAIDWEYCAMGNRWYDIAVVVNGDSLGGPDTEELLLAYLGRAASDRERQELHRYGCVYRYLELLWYLALERPVLEPHAIEGKVAELVNMLQRQRD